MSTDDEHSNLGATLTRTDQLGLRTKRPGATGPNNTVAGVGTGKVATATGEDDRAVVKQPVDQKAKREDILAKINAYNDIKPDAKIKAPDFLNAEHDPQKTEGLIGASTACIKVINGLIGNASDDVKSQTRGTRKALQDKINKYRTDEYTGHDKLQSLDPNPELTGGKRKRSKKIGTKKKQYKRK